MERTRLMTKIEYGKRHSILNNYRGMYKVSLGKMQILARQRNIISQWNDLIDNYMGTK